MNIFWINVLGVLLIALIVWWFWLSKPSPLNHAEESDENEMSHH